MNTRHRATMLATAIAAFGAVALVAGPAMAAPPVGGVPVPYVPVTHHIDFDADVPAQIPSWTVPSDIYQAKVTLLGGNGGANRNKINDLPNQDGIPGGTGAAMTIDLPVQPGEVLTVAVGLAGQDANNTAPGAAGSQQAAGGAGGLTEFRTTPSTIFSHGGAGGAATLLFKSPSSSGAPSLVAVAGGGGGAGGNIGGSSVSQGGMGGFATLTTANNGDPGPSGDEGCPPVAGGQGGAAVGMVGGTGQSVTDLLTQVKGAGGGGGGGYLGGLGGSSGDESITGCSASGGGGGAGSSWFASGTVASEASRPAGLLNGKASISWTDPTPVATLTASSVDLAAGDTLNLAAAVSLLPAVTAPVAVFTDGDTVLGRASVASDGSATLSVTGLASGLHLVSVAIVADNIAYATSATIGITVKAAVVPTTPPGPATPSVTTTPVPATESLAQTGSSGALAIVAAAAVFLLAGGLLMALRRRTA
nr:LPXTG cell wall anchor domain-containing protein [Arthrobacter sp. GMC3]